MLIDFGIKDIIDIFMVAVLLYYVYILMKASRSLNVFIGIMVFVIFWLIVSQILEMRLMGSIMSQLINVGVIGLIVLFQEEIRKFFYNVGSHRRVRRLAKWFGGNKRSINVARETIMPIVMACMNMSRQKVGALIVVGRENSLEDITSTGDIVDARINQRLIENIFFKNS